MANYCSSCGNSVSSGDSFCPNCGASLNVSSTNFSTANNSNGNSNASAVLGTLVAVTLLGGVTRNLYYWHGRYFLDPYCRRPFMGANRIVGGPRIAHGPMGGPVGPHGGGPHGGGPHGGGRR